jgi:hypothetical protein
MRSGDSDDVPNCKPEQPTGSDDEFAGVNWRRLLLSAVPLVMTIVSPSRNQIKRLEAKTK